MTLPLYMTKPYTIQKTGDTQVKGKAAKEVTMQIGGNSKFPESFRVFDDDFAALLKPGLAGTFILRRGNRKQTGGVDKGDGTKEYDYWWDLIGLDPQYVPAEYGQARDMGFPPGGPAGPAGQAIAREATASRPAPTVAPSATATPAPTPQRIAEAERSLRNLADAIEKGDLPIEALPADMRKQLSRVFGGRRDATGVSIERQVSLKAAVEVAVASMPLREAGWADNPASVAEYVRALANEFAAIIEGA